MESSFGSFRRRRSAGVLRELSGASSAAVRESCLELTISRERSVIRGCRGSPRHGTGRRDRPKERFVRARALPCGPASKNNSNGTRGQGPPRPTSKRQEAPERETKSLKRERLNRSTRRLTGTRLSQGLINITDATRWHLTSQVTSIMSTRRPRVLFSAKWKEERHLRRRPRGEK